MLFVISIISCNDSEKLIKNGRNKVFSEIIGKDSLFIKIYNNKNNIIAKGIVYKDSFKVGKWDYFTDKGIIDKTFEFMIIRGEQYTNQSWYYKGSKKDTMHELGNYYKFEGLKKNYKTGDTLFINIKYKPVLALNSDIVLVTGQGIKKDFSNIENIRLDTIYGVNMNVGLNIILKKSGHDNIRGILKEFYRGRKTTNDSIEYRERNIFFDKEIYVE